MGNSLSVKIQFASLKAITFIVLLLVNSIAVKAQSETKKNDEQELILVVEKMPEFVGGYDSLKQFIKTSAVYTEDAISEEISGRVFISPISLLHCS